MSGLQRAADFFDLAARPKLELVLKNCSLSSIPGLVRILGIVPGTPVAPWAPKTPKAPLASSAIWFPGHMAAGAFFWGDGDVRL